MTTSATQDRIQPADEYYGEDYAASQVSKYKSRGQNHWRERMGKVLDLFDEVAPKPCDVLDLACGIGAFSIAASERGHRVTGIDYSEPSLRAARTLAAEAGARVTFVQGDATKMPFEDASFDHVIASDVIEHLFDPPLLRMFKECHRVLRRGGTFVLHTTPTRYQYLMSPLRALPLVPLAWLPQPALDRAIELYDKYPFAAVYKAVKGDTWMNLAAKRDHCNCPEYRNLRALLTEAGLTVERYIVDHAPSDFENVKGYSAIATLFKRSNHFKGHIWGVCRKT